MVEADYEYEQRTEVDRYVELIEAQEELESIRAYDDAKASNAEPIPFAQAFKEIESA